MPLQYVKHESFPLKGHPEFSEVWLHDRICKDTAIHALSELTVVERQPVQFGGGRLDMCCPTVKAQFDMKSRLCTVQLTPVISFARSNIGTRSGADIQRMTT